MGLLALSVASLLGRPAGTAAFAAPAVGHLNLLSVAFAVLYFGLGSDYHHSCAAALQGARGRGANDGEALVETVRGVGSSLVLCAVTTAAGFYSFIPTPFHGVSELGLISGTGMFFSLFVSLTLLPAFSALFIPPEHAARVGRWLGTRCVRPLLAAAAARASAPPPSWP